MLKKFCIFIVLLSSYVIARDPDLYVEKLWDKKYLRLKNGQEVILARLSDFGGPYNQVRIFMRKNKKVLWDVVYEDAFDNIWDDAYFIPVTKNKFIDDLNDDGYPEIGVATSHGGQAVWRNVAVIFTVKENKLEVLKTQQINTEFSRSVYKTKNDSNNSNYKCSVCEPNKLFIRQDVLEK